ncbi:MAG: A/G-specific adenine glycosylase [Bacteroidetes bacterium]|nr:MAG: A/G-specific adenine glycosylase [Bacteroidota bacterium]
MLEISNTLIVWYEKNKRDLPWRNCNDPYKIWLSEIILQQTRVQQGLPYYLKFVEQYPTILDLANADEQEILTMWQGLGYYSRARNMHATARYISFELNGYFPTKYSDIRALKGVGDYTAAAISSFAYGSPYPVIDGNVYRLISRLFNISLPVNKPSGQKEVKAAVESIFDGNRAAQWNQAIMEFGSLHCTPKKPKCETCVLQTKCISYSKNTVSNRPVKEGKIKVTTVNHSYFVFRYKDHTYIEKRIQGIWKNLYQFPLIEENLPENEVISKCKNLLTSNLTTELVKTFESTHLLSHRKIKAIFYTINLNTKPLFLKRDIFEIDLEQLGNLYPTSVLILKYLNQ